MVVVEPGERSLDRVVHPRPPGGAGGLGGDRGAEHADERRPQEHAWQPAGAGRGHAEQRCHHLLPFPCVTGRELAWRPVLLPGWRPADRRRGAEAAYIVATRAARSRASTATGRPAR